MFHHPEIAFDALVVTNLAASTSGSGVDPIGASVKEERNDCLDLSNNKGVSDNNQTDACGSTAATNQSGDTQATTMMVMLLLMRPKKYLEIPITKPFTALKRLFLIGMRWGLCF
jgi:hypothetical protein